MEEDESSDGCSQERSPTFGHHLHFGFCAYVIPRIDYRYHEPLFMQIGRNPRTGRISGGGEVKSTGGSRKRSPETDSQHKDM